MAGDPPATPPATSAANTGSNIGSRSGSRRSGGHVPVAGRSAAADWQPPHLEATALVQTHCHQHAVLGGDRDAELMKRAAIDAHQLQSGCCGLAGNFGFE